MGLVIVPINMSIQFQEGTIEEDVFEDFELGVVSDFVSNSFQVLSPIEIE